MSQNDFNLANQGFPQMRADMNSAFQALASNSSGATAPGTTYAYQFWYDTTTNILKMRNAANSSWISIGSFDQATNKFTIEVSSVNSLQTQLDGKLSSTNPVISQGTITEKIYTISGTSVLLEPDNGSVQTHTLVGATTYTDGFSSGQAITLMIDDGSGQTITWPGVEWKTDGGSAPALNEAGFTVVVLWKVETKLYGARVGDA